MNVLALSDVYLRLGRRPVLDGINLTVEEGAFVGLIGSNGAGKTTLLRVALGLLKPDRGSITRSGSVGYVPQSLHLDADLPLRVTDFVGLGIDGHRFGWRRRRPEQSARIARTLEITGMEHLADARVGRLSGGEQQRAVIAHALAGDPKLLVLDEPLANLDLSAGRSIVEVLDLVRRTEGVAVVLSAHDLNPLLPYMDRISYMADGRVVTGRPDEVVRSEVLSELYRHRVDVVEVQGRVLVVAGDNSCG